MTRTKDYSTQQTIHRVSKPLVRNVSACGNTPPAPLKRRAALAAFIVSLYPGPALSLQRACLFLSGSTLLDETLLTLIREISAAGAGAPTLLSSAREFRRSKTRKSRAFGVELYWLAYAAFALTTMKVEAVGGFGYSSQPPVLPTHSPPQFPSSQQGSGFVLAFFFFWIADKVLNSKFLAKMLHHLVTYMRKNATPDSNIEKAFRAAQAFTPAFAEAAPRGGPRYATSWKYKKGRRGQPPQVTLGFATLAGSRPIPEDQFVPAPPPEVEILDPGPEIPLEKWEEDDEELSDEQIVLLDVGCEGAENAHSVKSEVLDELLSITHSQSSLRTRKRERDKFLHERLSTLGHIFSTPQDYKTFYPLRFSCGVLWRTFTFAIRALYTCYTSRLYVSDLGGRVLAGIFLYRFYVYPYNIASLAFAILLPTPAQFRLAKGETRAKDEARDPRHSDLSLADTDASSISTIPEDPISGGHIEFDTGIRDAVIKLGDIGGELESESVSASVFDTLATNSGGKMIASFLVLAFTAPSFTTEKVKCVAHHFANFSNLFGSLRELYGPAIRSFLSVAEKEFKQLLQMSFFSQTDTKEEPTWMQTFAEGFEQLEKFQETPVGIIVSAVLGLITSLPFLVSKCYSAENWAAQWKALVSVFRTTGASVASVLRSILQVNKTAIETDATWSSSSVMSQLLSSTPFHKEYAECREIFRKVNLGMIDFDPVEANDFENRLQRLEKLAISRTARSCSASDLSMAKDCTELFASMVTWSMTNTPRIVPFVHSIDGLPGIGKSTVVDKISELLHVWSGIKDLMKCVTLNLTAKTDEQTKNNTTLIFLDDTGNAKGNARAAGVSPATFIVDNVNSTHRIIQKADLPDKGRHCYRNRFVIFSDNSPTCGMEEDLRDYFAGLRRKGPSVQMKCREEYADPSGMLDISKAKDVTPYGEHLLFRPYKWVKDGNTPPSQQNVFGKGVWGDGWVDHFTYYAWLKEEHDKHFENQKQMLLKQKENKNLPLCGNCKILPFKVCKCATEFLEARAEAGLDCLNFAHFTPASISDILVMKARFYMCSHSLLARALFFCLESNLLEFLSVGILCASAFLFDYSKYGITLGSVSFFLSRVLKRSWRKFRYHTIPELLMAHSASWGHASRTFAYAIGGMAMVLASPMIFKAIVNMIPDKPKAQTAVETTDVVPTVETDPAKASVAIDIPKPALVPIWAKVRKRQIVADHRTRTISSDDLMAKLRQNSLDVKVRSHKTGEVQPVKILFLNSEIAVSVAHAFVFEGEIGNVSLEIPDRKPVIVETCRMFVAEGKDLIFLYLQKNFPPHTNLVYYLSDNVVPKLFVVKTIPGPLHTVSEPQWVEERIEAVLKETTYEMGSVHCLKLGKQPLYEACGRVLHTEKGQCGLPYLGESTHKILAGIHVAGNRITTNWVMPVVKSDYEAAVDFFVSLGFGEPLHLQPYTMKAGTPIAETSPDPKHPVNFMPDDGRPLEVFQWRAKNFTPKSMLRNNPYLAEARRFLKVRLFKARPFLSPRASGRKVLLSASAEKPLGNANLMVKASKLISEQITKPAIKRIVPEEFMTRPLTIEEVINGIPGKVDSIPLSTSSGVGGKKRDFVIGDVGERTLTPDMLEDVNNILAILKDGGNPWLSATACVKDEPRAPGKLARLFYNPVMPQFIIMSMYARNLINAVTAQPIQFSTAIGMNPVGPEWAGIVELFTGPEFEGNCFDLDYEAFDTSQNELLRSVVDRIFLDIAEALWTEREDIIMLRRILSWCNDTPVDMLGAVMYLKLLMLSGFLWTAHSNGFETLHIVVADFVRFWTNKGRDPNAMVLHDFVRAKTLGDDTVAAVSKPMRDQGWTIQHLVDTASSYGMVLTTANKDLDFKFKKYEDCEFLKRYYNYHIELQANVAALSPKSYLQPFHTYTPNGELTVAEYQSMQTETALREAFFGGRKSFNEIRYRLNEYYDKIELGRPSCLDWTYDALVEEYKPFFTPQPQMFSYTETGYTLLLEYDEEPTTPIEAEDDLAVSFFNVAKDAINDAKAEADAVEGDLLQQLEGEVQDSAGYTNVYAAASRMPLDPVTNVDDILKRRQFLRDIQVPLASGTGLVITPHVELMSQDIFQTRANHAAFRAAGVKLTFVTTAPPTVTGCFMASICYEPDPAESAASLAALDTASAMCLLSQRPHILMRVGENSNVWHLEVPFISRKHANYAFDLDPWDKPAVVFKQLVPLTTSLAQAPVVVFKVYAEFTGLLLYGATAVDKPVDGNTFRAESGDEDGALWATCELPVSHSVDFQHFFIASGAIRNAPYPVALDMWDDYWDMFCPQHRGHLIPGVTPKPRDPGYCYLSGFDPKLRKKAADYLGPFPLGIAIYTCPVTLEQDRINKESQYAMCVSVDEVGVTKPHDLKTVHMSAVSCSDFQIREASFVFSKCIFGGELPKEKISTRILKVSNTATAILDTVGPLAAPLAALRTPIEILEMAGNALQKFGFSKPLSTECARPSAFFPNACGADYADVLAIDPLCEVAPGLPGAGQDEMTFANISRKWSLVRTFTIDPSLLNGLELLHINVTPTVWVEGRPAACALPGLFHKFWRGGMEYKIEIYCPLLIALRMRISYDPLGPAHLDLNNTPPEPKEDYQEHLILDSSTNQSVEFTVGYSSAFPALSCHPDGAASTAGLQGADFFQYNSSWRDAVEYADFVHNGHIKVSLVDIVSGSSGTPMPIYGVVWTRAAEDMQWGAFLPTLPSSMKLPALNPVPLVINEASCVSNVVELAPTCESAQNVTPTVRPSQTTVTPTFAMTAPPSTGLPTTAKPSPAPTTKVPTPAPTSVAPTPAPVTMFPTPLPTEGCVADPMNWFTGPGLTVTSWHNRGTGIVPASAAYSVGVAPSAYVNTKTWLKYNTVPETKIRLPLSTIVFGPNCVSSAEFRLKKLVTEPRGTWWLTYRSTESTIPEEGFTYENKIDLTALAIANTAAADSTYYYGNFDIVGGNCLRTGLTGRASYFAEKAFVYLTYTGTPDVNAPLEVGNIKTYAVPDSHVIAHCIPCTGPTFSLGLEYIRTPLDSLTQEQISETSIANVPNPALSMTYDTATMVMQNGANSIPIPIFSWDDWLVFQMNGVTTSNSTPISPYPRVPVQFIWFGRLEITAEENCFYFMEDQNKWQETVLALPVSGFLIKCPRRTSTARTDGVARISILSSQTQAWFNTVGQGWPVPLTRRLAEKPEQTSYFRSLFNASSAQAEAGEVIDAANTEVSHTFHLGAPLDHSEFFVRQCVGEQSLSFRELLKIPQHTMAFQPAEKGTYAVAASVFTPALTSNYDRMLFRLLSNTFYCWRGGLMYHYVILGNGCVEVSTVAGRSDPVLPFARGASFTDSRVNPKLSVKIPWQENVLFAFCEADWECLDWVKYLRITKMDDGFLLVREYMSSAEDFSFHYFRGTPQFQAA